MAGINITVTQFYDQVVIAGLDYSSAYSDLGEEYINVDYEYLCASGSGWNDGAVIDLRRVLPAEKFFIAYNTVTETFVRCKYFDNTLTPICTASLVDVSFDGLVWEALDWADLENQLGITLCSLEQGRSFCVFDVLTGGISIISYNDYRSITAEEYNHATSNGAGVSYSFISIEIDDTDPNNITTRYVCAVKEADADRRPMLVGYRSGNKISDLVFVYAISSDTRYVVLHPNKTASTINLSEAALFPCSFEGPTETFYQVLSGYVPQNSGWFRDRQKSIVDVTALSEEPSVPNEHLFYTTYSLVTEASTTGGVPAHYDHYTYEDRESEWSIVLTDLENDQVTVGGQLLPLRNASLLGQVSDTRLLDTTHPDVGIGPSDDLYYLCGILESTRPGFVMLSGILSRPITVTKDKTQTYTETVDGETITNTSVIQTYTKTVNGLFEEESRHSDTTLSNHLVNTRALYRCFVDEGSVSSDTVFSDDSGISLSVAFNKNKAHTNIFSADPKCGATIVSLTYNLYRGSGLHSVNGGESVVLHEGDVFDPEAYSDVSLLKKDIFPFSAVINKSGAYNVTVSDTESVEPFSEYQYIITVSVTSTSGSVAYTEPRVCFISTAETDMIQFSSTSPVYFGLSDSQIAEATVAFLDDTSSFTGEQTIEAVTDASFERHIYLILGLSGTELSLPETQDISDITVDGESLTQDVLVRIFGTAKVGSLYTTYPPSFTSSAQLSFSPMDFTAEVDDLYTMNEPAIIAEIQNDSDEISLPTIAWTSHGDYCVYYFSVVSSEDLHDYLPTILTEGYLGLDKYQVLSHTRIPEPLKTQACTVRTSFKFNLGSR